jgi:predicted pyridoxine 5'-phosphate oxidase superfamily flavin-nucleotide-binding protein
MKDEADAMDKDRSPFHAGEIALQHAAGVHERLREVGPRVIRDHMPDQHREFFEQLPSVLVGSVDALQRPWASMLAGLPGFMQTPDARRLRIDVLPRRDDPLHAQLRVGASLGLLGIEPQTRRRNRMNGRVVVDDERGFEVAVEQSFGNCPQYIQARTPSWVNEGVGGEAARAEGPRLGTVAAALVARSDTLFVASAAPGQGADVSHRGGKPGFVRVDDGAGGTVLTLPDFRGNFFFNTLGNVHASGRAGLLFADHEGGDVLQLTGRAAIISGGPEVTAFAGAQRLLRIEVEAGWWTPQALPLRWSAPEPAPQLAATGHW